MKDIRLVIPIAVPQVHWFSFSDTFVLCSHGSSETDFFNLVCAANFLATCLFAMSLPVRGAITMGEAEFVPNTDHLIGEALVRAAELEKSQDWFGVIIDPAILDSRKRQILEHPLIKPIVLDYDVPFKASHELSNPSKVLNWRYNMAIEKGTASLFRPSNEPNDQLKINNTLKFCLWVRTNLKDRGFLSVYDASGELCQVPWLKGCCAGTKPPDHPDFCHGDEY